MKKAFSVACFLGLALSGNLLNIKVGDRVTINNQSTYNLSCEGATGAVKFYVEGTPYGVSLSGASIVISSYAQSGNYTLRIKAVDELGQSAERVVTLSIVQNNGQATLAGQTVSGNGGFGVSGQVSNQNTNQSNTGTQTIGGVQIGQTGGVSGQVTGQSVTQTSTSTSTVTGSTVTGSTSTGSSSTGTQPNGGTSGSSSSVNNNRLDGLISNYSSSTTVTTNYGTSGRYPETNLPTSASSNLVNLTPITIATQQTTPTQSNRNTITADDVTLRAASERHQNAIKGITNLLAIIDQANANKNKAQSDIQTYTQAYNDAVTAQRTAQNDIITIETKSSQIVSALNSLNATITDLKNRLNTASTQNSGFLAQKNTILTTITSQEKQKAQLLEQLKNLNDQVGQKAKELSDKTSECQLLTNNVNSKSSQLASAQNELANGATIRPQLENDINEKSRTVDSLRVQLQQAQKALADAKIKLADFDSRRLTLPNIIATLQRELNDLQTRAQNCQAELARLQAALDALKTGDSVKLTTSIATLDTQINQSRTQVSQIDIQISSSQAPLADLQTKLAKANEDLVFLRTQKTEVETNLRLAYQRGNDANNRVAIAKQNLDAVIKRFQDESKTVSDATLNLERARAEEALARLGLEELIALYTNALPYAIVPNGNGVGSGSPTGNNPSGSALGPINTSGNGAPGSFTVSSWTNYLSSAFGAGVHPSFPGSVTTLYPFNFLSTTSGNQGTNTTVNNQYGNLRNNGNTGTTSSNGTTGSVSGNCGLQGTQQVTVGTVVAVRDTSFDVRAENGKVYTIQVAPCTALNSNQANYQVKSGHEAIVKGYYQNNNSNIITGEQITCLA